MKRPDRQKEYKNGQEYDPISAVRANSLSVARAFLKEGASLTIVQRAGVFLISLMIIGWGLYFGLDAIDAYKANGPRVLSSAPPSIFLIVFGLLGLRNAMRFRGRR